MVKDIFLFNIPQSSDAGVYQCYASNEYGISRGEPFEVIEIEKKLIKISNVNLIQIIS